MARYQLFYVSCFLSVWLVSMDSTLLPVILSLAFPPTCILFSYLPVNMLIKPIIVTYSHTVYRRTIPQHYRCSFYLLTYFKSQLVIRPKCSAIVRFAAIILPDAQIFWMQPVSSVPKDISHHPRPFCSNLAYWFLGLVTTTFPSTLLSGKYLGSYVFFHFLPLCGSRYSRAS